MMKITPLHVWLLTVALNFIPQLTAPPPCSSPVDLAFIIDSSGSVSRSDYLKQKDFVKAVAKSFGLAPNQSQAAIVLYSNSASVQARFGQYPTTEEFGKAVDALPYERGLTRIDKALDVAATEIFPEGRAGVPKIALLITDGTQTQTADAKDLREASKPLRKSGVRVLAVGVGSVVDLDQLRLVTETDNDVMMVDDFEDLPLIIGNLTDLACKLDEIPCPPEKMTDNPQGRCCVFPFKYKGKSYDSCTKFNHDRLWCSLTAVYGDPSKEWANCVSVKLTNVSDDQTVREGSNTKLFCEATGSPTPKITWIKVLRDGSKIEVLHQGTILNFQRINRTASGVYQCTADNGFGKPVSHKISLSVILGTRLERVTAATPTNSKTATPTSSSDIVVSGGSPYIYTILGAVIGILVAIIIGLVIYIVWRQKKGITGGERSCQATHDEEGANLNNDVEMAVLLPDPNSSSEQTAETCSQSQYLALNEETRLQEVKGPALNNTSERSAQNSEYAPLLPSTRSWEVARGQVTIEKIIGKGAFGQVAKGTATDLRGGPQRTLVAVKMLKDNAPDSDRNDLLSELAVMKKLKPHRHVIKLLGCVTESEPLLVLIEYVPFGDLLGYLRKSRGLNDTYYNDPDIKPKTSLTSHQLMKFAWQIADGMSYLSSKSIIHRDLAARNVLIGERETCKVTDFGMARDVSQKNIYERKSKGRLPVKWTAVEALLYNKYSTKSDVWSYGILLYELSTIGGSPYPRMKGQQVIDLLKQGYRMPKPEHVDNKLYEIMEKCWQNDPNTRPTFVALRSELKEMENEHKRLINMKLYDKQLYANVEDLGGSTDCINV